MTDPALLAFWEVVRERLERYGTERRGRIRIPDLPSRCRLTIESVVGHQLKAWVDLDELEAGLVRLAVADDLVAALGRLGAPVSTERAEQRAARDTSRRARAAAAETVSGWRTDTTISWDTSWVSDWLDEIVRTGLLSGLDVDEAVALVESTRRVIDAVISHRAQIDAPPLSRVDLAAAIIGSAHALDPDERLHRTTARALSRLLIGGGTGPDNDPWEIAGVHTDLLSGAALTWNLPVSPDHPLAIAVSTSTAAGVPFVFTRLALQEHPLCIGQTRTVLAVENPRVLEYAAQRHSDLAVICTNGNPSNTVQLMLSQLTSSGVSVRYHGDFDSSGLAITGRMSDVGLRPWKMDEATYRAALVEATDQGVELPVDEREAGPTPWAPMLEAAFNERRLVVHQERLLGAIIGE